MTEQRLHHTSDPVCPKCEDKLKEAHPLLGVWFRNEVKPNFKDAHISWSYRGKEDQEACVLAKTSKDHFPFSPHNKTDPEGKPCSIALDLFRQDGAGKGFWEKDYCEKINAHNESKKLPFLWGGHFKHLGDFDHFQLDHGEVGTLAHGS